MNDEPAPSTHAQLQPPSTRRPPVAMGIALLFSLLLFAGCGHGAAGSVDITAYPTDTAPLSPSATVIPMATFSMASATPTGVRASGVCQPDPFGIYADQTTFVTTLDEAPLPAPPQTKHGIGSAGANASVMQGGESGVCTIGTFVSVTDFYAQRLAALGWRYAALPPAFAVCYHSALPARAWWKGSETFAWYDNGDAGGGSIFWSYTYCLVQS